MKLAQDAPSLYERILALGTEASPALFGRFGPSASKQLSTRFQDFLEQQRATAAAERLQGRVRSPQTDEELMQRLMSMARQQGPEEKIMRPNLDKLGTIGAFSSSPVAGPGARPSLAGLGGGGEGTPFQSSSAGEVKQNAFNLAGFTGMAGRTNTPMSDVRTPQSMPGASKPPDTMKPAPAGMGKQAWNKTTRSGSGYNASSFKEARMDLSKIAAVRPGMLRNFLSEIGDWASQRGGQTAGGAFGNLIDRTGTGLNSLGGRARKFYSADPRIADPSRFGRAEHILGSARAEQLVGGDREALKGLSRRSKGRGEDVLQWSGDLRNQRLRRMGGTAGIGAAGAGGAYALSDREPTIWERLGLA